MASLSLSIIAILILAAFLPSIIYMVIVKNTERRRREPTILVFVAFLRGATLSVIIAIFIELILIYLVFDLDLLRASDLLGSDPIVQTLILACIIAPVTEEATKALGIIPSITRARELEDGIVYGAAVGLGFAATENLFYETSAYIEGGLALWAGTTFLRTISSALLHASASSVAGYGLSARKFTGVSWLPYYLIAVVLHGIFNLAASAGPLLEDSWGDSAYLFGLVAAIVIAVCAFSWSRGKIRRIEHTGGWA